MDREVVIIDGANVAYIEASKAGKPKVSNIVAVYRALEEMGYNPIIVVDASLRHEIDDPDQLEALIERQTIRQAPANTSADYFVLALAEQFDALIVSNDSFRSYREQYPWIDERRIPLMIVEGHTQLHERKLESGS